MAAIERLKRTNDLKVSLLQNMAAGNQHVINMYYDSLADTLIFLFVSRDTPTIVHYIDEHVALLYQPGNNEVVGVQVEDFQASFVNEYVNVQKVWKLSESCKDLNIQDLGDISIVFERQKPMVAREVARVTEDILYGKGSSRRDPVPAD